MKILRFGICLPLLICLFLFILILGNVWADEFKNLPVKGMVTMIDLGAKKCIPCKMMAPILEKMERKYEGKAAVVFIDVWNTGNRLPASVSEPFQPRSFLMLSARKSIGMLDFWLKKYCLTTGEDGCKVNSYD